MARAVHVEGLDILRGGAALWVMLYHFHDGSRVLLPPLITKLFSAGYLGVPVFFVISGLCIASSAARAGDRAIDAVRFLGRRARRIYPPFWCSVAIALLLPLLVEVVSFCRTGRWDPVLGGVMEWGLLDWVGLLTLMRGATADAARPEVAFNAINGGYWSLFVEMQFYVLVTIALATRRRTLVLCSVTGASVLLLLAGTTVPRWLFIHGWPLFATGWLVHSLCLGWGGWSRLTHGRRLAIVCASAAIGIVLLTLVTALHRQMDRPDLLAAAAALWLILSLHAGAPYLKRARSSSAPARGALDLLTMLGTCSFTLYLIHPRAGWFFSQSMRWVLAPDSVLAFLLVCVATVFSAAVLHRIIERPFTRTCRSASAASGPALPFRVPQVAEDIQRAA